MCREPHVKCDFVLVGSLHDVFARRAIYYMVPGTRRTHSPWDKYAEYNASAICIVTWSYVHVHCGGMYSSTRTQQINAFVNKVQKPTVTQRLAQAHRATT